LLHAETQTEKRAAVARPPAWVLKVGALARENVELMLHDSMAWDYENGSRWRWTGTWWYVTDR
jgi:hypothetical protein